MKTIGERLLFVRGEMKQGEFAKRLNINPNTLRNYESGRVLPNQDILERVCVQFSVNPTWLLLGIGAEKNEEAALAPKANTAACSRCVELYEKLTLAQGKVIQAQEQKEALLKENGELKTLSRENQYLKEKIDKLEYELEQLKNTPSTPDNGIPKAS